MQFSEEELKLLVGALDNLVRQGGLNAAAQVMPLAKRVEEHYLAEFGQEGAEAPAPARKKRGK